MVCVCGARLPVDNPVSICNTCMKQEQVEEGWTDEDEDELSDMHADYFGVSPAEVSPPEVVVVFGMDSRRGFVDDYLSVQEYDSLDSAVVAHHVEVIPSRHCFHVCLST